MIPTHSFFRQIIKCDESTHIMQLLHLRTVSLGNLIRAAGKKIKAEKYFRGVKRNYLIKSLKPWKTMNLAHGFEHLFTKRF